MNFFADPKSTVISFPADPLVVVTNLWFCMYAVLGFALTLSIIHSLVYWCD